MVARKLLARGSIHVSFRHDIESGREMKRLMYLKKNNFCLILIYKLTQPEVPPAIGDYPNLCVCVCVCRDGKWVGWCDSHEK